MDIAPTVVEHPSPSKLPILRSVLTLFQAATPTPAASEALIDMLAVNQTAIRTVTIAGPVDTAAKTASGLVATKWQTWALV